MNGKTETTAARLRQKRSLSRAIFVITAAIIYLLPKELLMETLGRIRRIGPDALRFMWRMNRGPLYGLAIFTALALVCLICLLRMVTLTARIKREPDNVPANARAKEKAVRPERKAAAAKPSPAAPILIGVIVTAVMAYAMAADDDNMIPALSTLVITFAVIAVTFASNKRKAKTGAKPAPQRRPAHADEAEEAITCSHRTGREKYIEQLESYLKAGLIDKAEYKVLRERYSKMDIPEDYH